MTQGIYELCGVNIVSEIFGGEVVAVNLDSGKYYSMLNAGAYIWSALLANHSAEQIAASLSAQCQLDLLSDTCLRIMLALYGLIFFLILV